MRNRLRAPAHVDFLYLLFFKINERRNISTDSSLISPLPIQLVSLDLVVYIVGFNIGMAFVMLITLYTPALPVALVAQDRTISTRITVLLAMVEDRKRCSVASDGPRS